MVIGEDGDENCWASKIQVKENRRVWKNWERLKYGKQSLIVELRDGSLDLLVDLGWERLA